MYNINILTEKMKVLNFERKFNVITNVIVYN